MNLAYDNAYSKDELKFSTNDESSSIFLLYLVSTCSKIKELISFLY